MRHPDRDKVIVITGASSGIGAATAEMCVAAGMKVALGARRTQKLEDLARRIDPSGRSVLAMRCDVDSDSDVESLVAATIEKFGGIDVAFANAGFAFYKSVADTTAAEARAIFETNFWGTWRIIRAVMPVMRKAGRGHIIINSSATSEISPPLFGMYSATKAAQDSIAGALRAEVREDGIFVTSVHPIGTNTEFYEHAADLSPGHVQYDHLPRNLRQTAETVAAKIVRSIGRTKPEPEIWPCPPIRFGLGIMTMFPRLSAGVLRLMFRNRDMLRATGPADHPDQLDPLPRVPPGS